MSEPKTNLFARAQDEALRALVSHKSPKEMSGGQLKEITAATLSSDHKKVFVANSEGKVVSFDLDGNEDESHESSKNVRVTSLAANSSFLAAGSMNGSICVWSISEATQTKEKNTYSHKRKIQFHK